MQISFDGLVWLLITLGLLFILQRQLHREIQAIFLIITRNQDITIWVFSLLFFPGVFLHEFSHLVMAKLLRVRTGSFSLLPRPMPDGHLQMGYVEAATTDVFRDSLVGLAPLISGMLFIALAVIPHLQLTTMWESLNQSQWQVFLKEFEVLPSIPDFWLWFYGTFAISSTMLPSESDRHAWLPVLLTAIVLLATAVLAGAGPWMLDILATPFNQFLRGTALVLLVSVIIHVLLIIPLALIHLLLSHLTGLDVK